MKTLCFVSGVLTGNNYDVAVAALMQARREVGRADRQLSRVNEQVSRLAPESARDPSELQKCLAVRPDRPSFGKLALRGLIGLLVAACIGAAATVLWPHGDAANQVTTREPQLYLVSSTVAESPVPAQSSPSAVQAAAPKAAPAASAPPAQTLLTDSAPTAAGPSPGQEQPLQPAGRGFLAAMEQEIGEFKTSIEQLKTGQEQMVRDNLAIVEQLRAAQEQMVHDNAAFAEQLKASQEQTVRDNAAVAGQLKASQEQMARLIAKASEQQLRPKTSASPPRLIATPTGKPVPKLSSPQARAQPPAPVQARPE